MEEIREGLRIFFKSEKVLGDQIFSGKIIKIAEKSFVTALDFDIKLPKNTKVEVYFLKGTNKHYFYSLVVPFEQSRMIRFLRPKKIKKSLLREYARVDVSLRAKIKKRDATEALPARVTNLSGNGMILHTDASYSEEDQVRVIFYIEEQAREYSLLAKIIRVEILFQKEEEYRYRVALKYQTLSEADRDGIVNYVHLIQTSAEKEST